MVLLCGIEEARRGPVIGPMVMCGVLLDEKDEHKLKTLGAKDSKLLTPRTRKILFSQIIKMVKKHKCIIIPPQEIDDAVNGKDGLNLNWLEAVTSAKIINALKPDKAVLDCPSTNIKAYANYVRKHLKNKDVEIIAEHKADLNHPSCSAASILAKVTGDEEIEKLKKKIGVNFGSGYPSDPVTKEFLRKNYAKYPEIFRKSWEPYKKLVKNKSQAKLDQF